MSSVHTHRETWDIFVDKASGDGVDSIGGSKKLYR